MQTTTPNEIHQLEQAIAQQTKTVSEFADAWLQPDPKNPYVYLHADIEGEHLDSDGHLEEFRALYE